MSVAGDAVTATAPICLTEAAGSTLKLLHGRRKAVLADGRQRRKERYKARIADSSGDVFESRNFTDFSSGVDERLSNVEYCLQQILDHFERFKGIDSDELAAAIAFALRGEVRGFGGA